MLDDAGLRCCALSTPLLKCVAPGFKPIERVEFDIGEAAKTFPIPVDEQYERSREMLDRSIEAATILGCNIVRCFSFWRTEDVQSVYPLLLEKLGELGPVAEKAGMRLAMENEHACNVADCGEAMQVLPKAPANVGLLWDVLNGVSTGEQPYPEGYEKLDKSRIFHVQLKDADLSAGSERFTYKAVGQGDMPYVQIFEALARDGYRGAISMETHFSLDGSGSRKASSRLSMQGILKALEAQAG
jgi:sugar phosphate isomerase/epimerase